MRGQRPAELVVGSVQLGLPYGIANRTGKPPRVTALRLVKRAADACVAVFDTALAPGPFPKPEVVQNNPNFVSRLDGRTMLGRHGNAAEIRGPVLFRASPASSFVTGAVLAADGGWTAW